MMFQLMNLCWLLSVWIPPNVGMLLASNPRWLSTSWLKLPWILWCLQKRQVSLREEPMVGKCIIYLFCTVLCWSILNGVLVTSHSCDILTNDSLSIHVYVYLFFSPYIKKDHEPMACGGSNRRENPTRNGNQEWPPTVGSRQSWNETWTDCKDNRLGDDLGNCHQCLPEFLSKNSCEW
jgi:hypothetical protein